MLQAIRAAHIPNAVVLISTPLSGARHAENAALRRPPDSPLYLRRIPAPTPRHYFSSFTNFYHHYAISPILRNEPLFTAASTSTDSIYISFVGLRRTGYATSEERHAAHARHHDAVIGDADLVRNITCRRSIKAPSGISGCWLLEKMARNTKWRATWASSSGRDKQQFTYRRFRDTRGSSLHKNNARL